MPSASMDTAGRWAFSRSWGAQRCAVDSDTAKLTATLSTGRSGTTLVDHHLTGSSADQQPMPSSGEIRPSLSHAEITPWSTHHWLRIPPAHHSPEAPSIQTAPRRCSRSPLGPPP